MKIASHHWQVASPIAFQQPACGRRLRPLRRTALNHTPHFPRYNGAQEKGIRDLKATLDQRFQVAAIMPAELALAVEVTAQEFNHHRRRCLKGRSACAVFHDAAHHQQWSKRQRQTIFRLLLQ